MKILFIILLVLALLALLFSVAFSFFILSVTLFLIPSIFSSIISGDVPPSANIAPVAKATAGSGMNTANALAAIPNMSANPSISYFLLQKK